MRGCKEEYYRVISLQVNDDEWSEEFVVRETVRCCGMGCVVLWKTDYFAARFARVEDAVAYFEAEKGFIL